MAKIVVVNNDSPHEFGFKRGDVTSVYDDNEPIGDDVVNGYLLPNGSRRRRWSILNVPGSKALYQHLLAPGDPTLVKGELKQVHRKNKLDLDALEVDTGKAFRIDAADKIEVAVSSAQVTGKLIEKEALVSDLVIGD